MTDTKPSPAETYAAVRGELIAALRSLDDATVSTIVPACPAWTVKDVVAHLSGLNAELLADVDGWLGSDEATTRQVGDRASLSLDQVIDEWQSMSAEITERFNINNERATALVADLVVHVYDLAEVLDQPTTAAAEATPEAAHRYIALLQERAAAELGVALTVELSDGTAWPPSGAGLAMTVRTSPYSFLRGLTGRSSRADVEAFDWSSDPTELLDRAWSQYGPFRS